MPVTHAGQRLDQALVAVFPQFTRSQLQQWIAAGHVRVENAIPRKRDRLRGGEQRSRSMSRRRPRPRRSPRIFRSTIVYEDADLLVINKPPGLVVHPGAGNREGTLLNALLHHLPPLAALPRAGIVHRLDKGHLGPAGGGEDRTGAPAPDRAARRARRARVRRVIEGVLIAGGTVEAPIGRHRHDRTRMAVSSRGKQAISHYRVLKNIARTRWRR